MTLGNLAQLVLSQRKSAQRHRNGAQRDVRSQPSQQLGDGDIEAGEIVTLETQSHREAPHYDAELPGCGEKGTRTISVRGFWQEKRRRKPFLAFQLNLRKARFR
jgi:hypothetical protein